MKISVSRLFMLFAPDELDVLVSGEPIFDWGALRKNAKYADGYTERSVQVRWFWEVFEEMTEREKTQFLRFSTGSDRAQIGGLEEVALIIQKTTDTEMLPVSHTCFNMFSLPAYRTKDVLRAKVLLAIEQTEGFGLV